MDMVKELGPRSWFLRPLCCLQLTREEYVENAVRFLSHPKVRDSPVVYRQSFVENKGLTPAQEIDVFLRPASP